MPFKSKTHKKFYDAARYARLREILLAERKARRLARRLARQVSDEGPLVADTHG